MRFGVLRQRSEWGTLRLVLPRCHRREFHARVFKRLADVRVQVQHAHGANLAGGVSVIELACDASQYAADCGDSDHEGIDRLHLVDLVNRVRRLGQSKHGASRRINHKVNRPDARVHKGASQVCADGVVIGVRVPIVLTEYAEDAHLPGANVCAGLVVCRASGPASSCGA